MATSTVSALLRRIGLGRLSRLDHFAKSAKSGDPVPAIEVLAAPSAQSRIASQHSA